MRKLKALILTFLVLTLMIACSQQEKSTNTIPLAAITEWNQKVFEMAVKEDGLLTLKGLRCASMMHIAMHDAINCIDHKYSAYSFHEDHGGADPLSAIATAGYTISSHEFPDSKETLNIIYQRWLGTITDSESKEQGISLGQKAANAILAKRKSDAWNGEASYTWHPMAPGVYAEFNEHSGTPEGFIFGAGWAKAQPFLLKSQDQFRSPPPPEITSNAYTDAFNEVKSVGGTNSEIRTADQAHLAMWWKDFVENSHNKLARSLVEKENLDLWDTARLFALLNMTIYDAYVNVFDNKFHYNHWRPYTAIRWADHDDNPDTEVDNEWNNLHLHTYAFPSYPSAHGTASSAAMTILAGTLGTGNDYSFTMMTEEVDKAGPFSGKIAMDPTMRSFSSFSQAGLEASMSRVYLGIHFRYDSEEGHRLGNEIGNFTLQHLQKP